MFLFSMLECFVFKYIVVFLLAMLHVSHDLHRVLIEMSVWSIMCKLCVGFVSEA